MEENIKSPIQQEDIIEAQIKEIIPDAYIIRERIDKCKICNREEDLRFGFCFDCANAQSIIGTGKGMWDDDENITNEIPASIANERLKKLLVTMQYRDTNEEAITN